MLAQLYAINEGLARRFQEGNEPIAILARLLEEAGELAQQVHHFEGRGIKREKYGEPDRGKLSKEVWNVLLCTLAIAAYYGIEDELAESVDRAYQRMKVEGWIE
jgi:NTP pyrophosphatase (non-canonical NTP hydrolase)